MSLISWAWRATIRSGVRKGVRDGVFGRDKSSLALGALVGGVKLIEAAGKDKPAETRLVAVAPGEVIELRHGPVPASAAEMRRLRRRARRLLRKDPEAVAGRGRRARRSARRRYEANVADWELAVARSRAQGAKGRKARKAKRQVQRAEGLALVAYTRVLPNGGDSAN